MSDPVSGGSNWFWEFLGVAVSVFIGLFGYTLKRVDGIETDLRSDQVEEVQALRAEITKMERSFNDRFQESRDDRNMIWSEIRDMRTKTAEQNAATLERISRLPTREEMLTMIERLTGRTTGRPTH